jgi:hypothetical protein
MFGLIGLLGLHCKTEHGDQAREKNTPNHPPTPINFGYQLLNVDPACG